MAAGTHAACIARNVRRNAARSQSRVAIERRFLHFTASHGFEYLQESRVAAGRIACMRFKILEPKLFE